MAAGEVGGAERTFAAQGQKKEDAYTLTIAEGDQVRLFHRVNGKAKDGASWRARTLGVNGSVLTVVGFTEDGVRLRREDGTEGVVKWQTLRDKETGRIRLTYGYAQVINPLQGVTSTMHINGAPGGTATLNAFTAYTAGSRHRRETILVTSEGQERAQIARTRSYGLGPITIADVWQNMGENLSRQVEKTTALSFREQAHEVRQGALHGMQKGLQKREQRVVEGQESTTLRQSNERCRLTRQLLPTRELWAAFAREWGRGVREEAQSLSPKEDLSPSRQQSPRLRRRLSR